jgi:hypothetical protein
MLFLPTYTPNYLINGGFDFAQLQAPGTLTTIADASLTHPDGWKVFAENNSVQYRRYKRGDSGSSFTNLTSNAYGRFAKITSNGQLAFAQIIEANDTNPLIGRSVRFQIQLRADSARTFKIGLLEWQSTANSLTSDIVSSWADPPTWATNYSLLNSASCSVTTSFQRFAVTGTPSSSCSNLLVVVWAAADVTASSGYVEAAEAGMYIGSQERDWRPLPAQTEIARCQRRVEVSYPDDTAPGTTSAEFGALGAVRGVALNTFFFSDCFIKYQVSKIKVPTITTYSPTTGASGKLREEGTATDLDSAISNQGTSSFIILGSGGNLTATRQCAAHWVSNGNL